MPSLKSVPLFVEEFHRARKSAPLNRFLVHGQSSDDEQHQYAKSQVRAALRRRVPPCTEISAAEPFSRPRQSSYDEQHQYAKSEVCAALRRRVPPCTEISAAEPFSRPRRAMMSSTNTPSLKSVPLFVEEFHRARKSAPLNRFLVHGQSSDDEQHQYAKSQVRAALRRRVPPCTEISAAEPFSRPRTCINTLDRPENKCILLLTSGTKSNETQQLENEVQQYVTIVTMVYTVAGAVLPAIMSLFLGSWSDKYGRKPLLTWPVLGITASSFLTVLFGALRGLGPWWYIITVVPTSVSGGSTAFFTGAFCYLSDITTESERSFRITFLQTGLLAGTIVGTLASPYLLQLIGSIPLLSMVAVAHTLAYVYSLVWIRESVKISKKGKFSSIFDASLVKELMKTCIKKRSNRDRTIIYLLIICCTFSIPFTISLDYMYTRNKLQWSLETFSIFSVVNTLMVITGSLVGVTILQKVLKINDMWLALLAYLSSMVDYFIKAFAILTWQMYVGASISMFSGLANPLIRSTLSKLLPPQELGKIFTLLSILNSIVQIMVPLVLSPLYSATLNDFPGSIYIVSAGIYAMVSIVLCCAKYYMWRYPSTPKKDIMMLNQ
ncbi:hypothetical protein EVAR_78064_1 [Eumeta japonica]|uniref:Proton-coupled folate transporter n=1 Tax=Eumeta variegata TaxID=151549 RepID=A0A4C1T1A2_EUMVA|nr:hypothetical protein EVAR_78064_1 [Eumeta japonica]